MSRISVRCADASDARTISDIERRYIDCPWTEAQIADEIKNPSSVFLVAEYEGEFAGYLSGVCAADECEVSNIAVIERFRRRKVGSGLFAALIDIVVERGVKTLFLLVRTDNMPAVALYESLGFSIVGTRKNYYTVGDAFVMKLEI